MTVRIATALPISHHPAGDECKVAGALRGRMIRLH
jgi:hypothetical protein